MVTESYAFKERNYLAVILVIFIMLSFQNWYFNSLTSQNQELINLNKEVLSSYKDLIDNTLKHSENIGHMKTIAEHLEKQNNELMKNTESLNNLFFDPVN